jgi:hypothetical protein
MTYVFLKVLLVIANCVFLHIYSIIHLVMTTNRGIQDNKIQNKMIQKTFYVSLLAQVEPFKLVGRVLNAQVNAVIAYPHLNA